MKVNNYDKVYFSWWIRMKDFSKHELVLGCLHTPIGKVKRMTLTGCSERQHHRTAQLTKSNAAFRSRKTKILGLRRMSQCSNTYRMEKMCLRSRRKLAWFSRVRPTIENSSREQFGCGTNIWHFHGRSYKSSCKSALFPCHCILSTRNHLWHPASSPYRKNETL